MVQVPSYQGVPAGIYPAKITRVDGPEDSQFGPAVFLTFEIMAGKYENYTLDRHMFSFKATPKSKLGKAFRCLVGEKPDGEPYDTDELLGKLCNVAVEINEAGYNRVTDIFAPTSEDKEDDLPF